MQQRQQEQQQQAEQHQRQQQKQQHRHHVASEPLNLSLHNPSVKPQVVSPQSAEKTITFLTVSSPTDGCFPAIRPTIYPSGGPRLLLASPSVLAQQSPSMPPQQQKATPSITTIQHHHHHHYYNGEGAQIKSLDQNADDYRLAKEAAYLSLTNERPLTTGDRSWHHIATASANGECPKLDARLRQTRTVQEVDLSSEDSECQSTWIKQETDTQSCNGTNG